MLMQRSTQLRVQPGDLQLLAQRHAQGVLLENTAPRAPLLRLLAPAGATLQQLMQPCATCALQGAHVQPPLLQFARTGATLSAGLQHAHSVCGATSAQLLQRRLRHSHAHRATMPTQQAEQLVQYVLRGLPVLIRRQIRQLVQPEHTRWLDRFHVQAAQLGMSVHRTMPSLYAARSGGTRPWATRAAPPQ